VLNIESRYPDGNKAILTKGQAEIGVPSNIEEEFAVAPSERKLMFWWAAKWNTTVHKWSGIVGELLLAVFSLLPDEADCLKLFDPEFREANGRQYRLNRSKIDRREARGWPSANLRWDAR
jgi:hypothetical protein